MAEPAVSFDDLLQQSRKKRKAEQLAQEIFGKNRHIRTPTGVKPSIGASLASRVGVNKRTASLPRSNTAPPRHARRSSPIQTSRPSLLDKSRTKSTAGIPGTASANGLVNNVVTKAVDDGIELNIKGAAGGPHVVVAQNFAPGTTAADIESVMMDVGGQLTDCHLIATNPTVIAEMTFVEKSGADAVIAMFNNKKADGRTLYVYMKVTGYNTAKGNAQIDRQPVAKQSEPAAIADTMEIDENAESREVENRLREERRGRPDRGPRDVFPAGPRATRGYEDNYYRGPRRAEPAYQDGRYGFGGGNRFDARDRYHDGGRLQSDGMTRGGQGWRR